jgi:plasmid segregation protein ParM
MIRAIDVGYGAVKGICKVRDVEYPSAVGDFRPIRFTVGLEGQELKNKLCVEYKNKSYFIGDIAYAQSSPRVTMNKNRFTSNEGIAIMLSALVLLSNNQYEDVKLVTGLPVNEYSELKDAYREALLGKHNVQIIDPDGKSGEYYAFDIQDVKVLPQPIGTIFDSVLDSQGKIENRVLAKGKIGVIDVGKFTVDLSVTDTLQFIDKSSTSYGDIGLFDAFKELSLALKSEGYDIPPDSLEPYIRGKKSINGLTELKEQFFTLQAEKIISRVFNTWSDIWSFDQVFITGGGSLVLGDHLIKHLGSEKAVICDNPTMTNCKGYFKFANKVWR